MGVHYNEVRAERELGPHKLDEGTASMSQPDSTHASTFLSTLTHQYDADGLTLEVRCLPPRGEPTDDPPPRRWFPLDRVEVAARACVSVANRWDVYVGVLPRVGECGKADGVQYAAWLFSDVDGGDEGPAGAYALLKGCGLPRPEMCVCSGGGAHAYWALAEPVYLPDCNARADFKSLLGRLVARIGGTPDGAHADPTAADVARILRVPCTINHKRGRPVTLVRCNDLTPRLSYAEWQTLLPPPPPPVYRPKSQPSGKVGDGLRAWAKRGFPEGGRHRGLTSAATWLIRDEGIPRADAEDLIREKAANSPGRHPISEREVEGIMRWA